MKAYEGMDLNYYVGYQEVFKCNLADRLDHQYAGKHLRILSLKLALILGHRKAAKRTTL